MTLVRRKLRYVALVTIAGFTLANVTLAVGSAGGITTRAAEAAAGSASALAPGGGSISAVAWSPSGRRIAWTQESDPYDVIWVAHADGSGARRVTPSIDALGPIQWLTDETIIYWANYSAYRLRIGRGSSLVTRVTGGFVLDRNNTVLASGASGSSIASNAITIVALAGGATTEIGDPRDRNDLPSLSPDGRRVVFVRFRCVRRGDCVSGTPAGIWLSSTSRNAPKRLTSSGYCPSWSPDGRRVLYALDDDVWSIGASGERKRLVARNAACAWRLPLTWAPSSTSFAAVDSTRRLLIVDADTHRRIVVSDQRVQPVDGFAWSPDARSLLVAAGSSSPQTCSSLWIVDAQTAKPRLLRRAVLRPNGTC